jgi:peptidoglycan hydrolase-like protein with peptidoglycan-binding domain
LTIGQPNDRHEQEADAAAERVMRMPDPDAAVSPPTAHVADSPLQRKCAGCEEEVQRSSEGTRAGGIEAPPIVHDVLQSPGQPLDAATRGFMEPRFAYDFGHVRVHADARAAESARAVNALAYTAGSHIVLASGHDAADAGARKLMAHELAHVIQQDGGMAVSPLQRQHVADTGWRYTPPASVTRSVEEIQGIVGATPDGVYGTDTRNAVIRYQTTLKAAGLYTGTIEGEWGHQTDVAHVAFALTRPSRGGYNCAGFAFKRFTWINLVPTRAILAGMTALPSCSNACGPWQHKFFLWEVDVQVRNTVTGATSATHHDFHIVGGQTDGAGAGPATVMSKNGQRPVVGPAAPATFEPVSGPALDQDNTPVPDHAWVISGTVESCYCSSTLP